MTIPGWVSRGIEQILADVADASLRVKEAIAVSGGSINLAARVDCVAPRQRGLQSFFVKWSPTAPLGCFEAEREGLETLRSAGAPLRIPEPIGTYRRAGNALLLLEYIAPGKLDLGYGLRLAEGLAALHAAPAGDGDALYGGSEPNFIGPLQQLNPASNAWGVFWRDARIHPQLERAWQGNRLPESGLWTDLLKHLADTADDLATAPSLLHGDLWAGNVFPDGQGTPTLVDPAAYRGDADVDLAMAQLFGGFPPDFDALYREARFGTADHNRTVSDARTALHQLYPLLVHVNLFGGSYAAQAEQAARRVLAFGRA